VIAALTVVPAGCGSSSSHASTSQQSVLSLIPRAVSTTVAHPRRHAVKTKRSETRRPSEPSALPVPGGVAEQAQTNEVSATVTTVSPPPEASPKEEPSTVVPTAEEPSVSAPSAAPSVE
jgi:hypothetical protein